MFKKITEDEIRYWECFYSPVAMTECLIPNNIKAPHVWQEDKDCECVKLRDYQFAMLDYSYMYADIPGLNDKENFRAKKGAGDIINVGARDLGKSFIMVVNCFLTLLHGESDESMICASTYGFLKKICQPIANLAKFHPFFQMFKKPGKACARFTGGGMEIDTIMGHVQYGKNEKVDSPEPGTAFHGVHAKKIETEEASYSTKEGTEKRIDSGSSIGHIERINGIPDIRMGSPLGDLLRDSSKKKWICRLPQYVRSDWDEKTKLEKIKEYGGEDCFDDKTEILTDSGWKKWFQISKTDNVLSLNPKTREAVYKSIDDIFIYDYEGYLNYFDNEYLNFAISNKHNLLISTLKKQQLSLVSFETIKKNIPYRKQAPIGIFTNCLQCGKQLLKSKKQKKFCSKSCQMKYMIWDYYPVSKFQIPCGFNFKGKKKNNNIIFKKIHNQKSYSFNINDWLEFLGWYCSEGWVSNSKRKTKNGKKYLAHEISISQCKSQTYINEIKNLFKRLGLNNYYNKSSLCFTFNSKQIAKYLENECGIGARNKKVPDFIKFLTPKQINIFLNAFCKGDGNGQRTEYYTSSLQLANDLQELIYKVGHESNILKPKDLMYVITERPIFKHHIRTSEIAKCYYKGKIWCVNTEPFHTIFIRRFNKCMWSGNSPSYKLNVEGELLEGSSSRWDMERIEKMCLQKDKSVKYFELGKSDFEEFDKEQNREVYKALVFKRIDQKVILENVPAPLKIIASDIGTTGSPSEVCIFFGDEKKIKWRYNIPLVNLTTQQQALCFKWMYDKLNGCFISLDCTNADGRSIADELVILGVPQEMISRPIMHAKMIVDFLKDENGKVQKDSKGNPLYKQEQTIDWACMELDNIFYQGLIEIPYNEKFLEQFASYFEVKIGTTKKFGTSSGADHLVQSFQCLSICRFLNLKANMNNLINQTDDFVGGF